MMTEIETKYQELGAENSFLGNPIIEETDAPDKKGKYRHYEYGSIYWHPETGAHEVHGAIRQKWSELGWERSILGYPTTSEIVTPDKEGRFNHFQGGSIYWHPEIGAHEVHGSIKQKWSELGWETSTLGYPISDEQLSKDETSRYNHFSNGSIYWNTSGIIIYSGVIWEKWKSLQFEDGPLGFPIGDGLEEADGSRKQFFSNGTISAMVNSEEPPLSIYTQNMAIVGADTPFRFASSHTSIDNALNHMIQKLRREQPDLVGLCEMFSNDAREKVKQELSEVYPFSISGPDEDDIEEDGGLLLLSRHPVTARNASIFRRSAGIDSLSNKGIVHLRITIGENDLEYDVFLTHTQDPDADGRNENINHVKLQLSHINSFIQTVRNPSMPAILMGDINTNLLNMELKMDLMDRLERPKDAWSSGGDITRWPLGITYDEKGSFNPDKPLTLISDPERNMHGQRLDVILGWNGNNKVMNFSNTIVVQEQNPSGRDLSDHYGVQTEIEKVDFITTEINQTIREVIATLGEVHCLEETDEIGDDSPFFELLLRSENHPNWERARSPKKNGVASGDIFSYGSDSPALSVEFAGNWIEVAVIGKEYDRFSGNEELGRAAVRIGQEELVEMIGIGGVKKIPRMTGDGGEYCVSVELRLL